MRILVFYAIYRKLALVLVPKFLLKLRLKLMLLKLHETAS